MYIKVYEMLEVFEVIVINYNMYFDILTKHFSFLRS